ncbi:MAG: hypothetical protein EXQ69_04235 [Acidimicrobiia bacterium]|nr:hypothetical protein [Acidimicrobiia bacterium]
MGKELKVGDRVVSSSGRPGVVTAVAHYDVRVQWDSDDEFVYCFNKRDGFILPAPSTSSGALGDD